MHLAPSDVRALSSCESQPVAICPGNPAAALDDQEHLPELGDGLRVLLLELNDAHHARSQTA